METVFMRRLAEIYEEYKDKDYKTGRTKFAQICGVTKGQIDGWLAGTGQPSLQTLMRVAQSLKLPVAFLLGETDARTFERTEFSQKLPPAAREELERFYDYLAHKYNIRR